MRPRNPAFTLIELLVVIAMIAVLIALLVSALGKSREAARIEPTDLIASHLWLHKVFNRFGLNDNRHYG